MRVQSIWRSCWDFITSINFSKNFMKDVYELYNKIRRTFSKTNKKYWKLIFEFFKWFIYMTNHPVLQQIQMISLSLDSDQNQTTNSVVVGIDAAGILVGEKNIFKTIVYKFRHIYLQLSKKTTWKILNHNVYIRFPFSNNNLIFISK